MLKKKLFVIGGSLILTAGLSGFAAAQETTKTSRAERRRDLFGYRISGRQGSDGRFDTGDEYEQRQRYGARNEKRRYDDDKP